MYRWTIVGFIIIYSLDTYAQFSEINYLDVKGTSIGIEKNSMAVLDYGFKNDIHLNLKHSMEANTMKYQYFQIGAFYALNSTYVQLCINPFFSSDYQASYINAGMGISVLSNWKNEYFRIGFSIMPCYDTDMKYQTDWAVSVSFKLYREISVFMEYSRKPEYRIAYKRAYAGLVFRTGNICVKPMLRIPYYDSGLRLDHSKVVISMAYFFNK